MAVDMVQEVFGGADVSWERTARVKPERLVVSVDGGKPVASVLQEHLSDHYRGPGADELRDALLKLKASST